MRPDSAFEKKKKKKKALPLARSLQPRHGEERGQTAHKHEKKTGKKGTRPREDGRGEFEKKKKKQLIAML